MQILIQSSSQQSRIRLMIDEVLLISSQSQANQLRSGAQVAQRLDTHSGLLANILDDHTRLRQLLSSTAPTTNESNQSLGNVSRPVSAHHTSAIVGIRTSMSIHPLYSCPSPCQCTCHKVNTLRTPSLFNGVFGALFLGYSGYPFDISPKCSNISCGAQSHFRARAIYFFPFWFLHKIIDITFEKSLLQGPCISLIVRGTHPTNADIERFTMLDDDEGIRRLFVSRSAHPNDLEYRRGTSPLNVCQ